MPGPPPEDDEACKQTLAYAKNLSKLLQPRSKKEYQTWRSLTRSLCDPALHQSSNDAASVDPVAWVCRNWRVTYLAWHWIPKLAEFWASTGQGGSSSGMPPCPHCHELPKEQRGTVTSHMWSNAPFRVAGIGDPEFYVAYQYLCQGCPGGTVGCPLHLPLQQHSSRLMFYSNREGSTLIDQHFTVVASAMASAHELL